MSYSYRGGAEGWTPKNSAAVEQDLGASSASGGGTPDTNRWIDVLSSLKFLRWANLISYLANVAVTYGVGMIGSGGVFGVELATNADVSSKYQTLVTPAGWSFAVIWSLIFAAQAFWVGRQFLLPVGGDSSGEKAVKAVGYRYLTTVICQGAWTVNFGLEAIIIAFLIMLIIWINLLCVVQNLDTLSYSQQDSNLTKLKNYALDKVPFHLHLGWITAAAVLNTNVLLVFQEVPTSGLFCAAIGSVVFICVLALIWLIKWRYITMPAVLVWALVGIYVELGNPQIDIIEAYSEEQIATVMYASIGVAAVLLLLVVVQAIRQYHRHSQKQRGEALHLGKVERGAPVYYRAPY